MYLYHVNVGWPVVDDGSELLAPARSVSPRGDYPAGGYERFHAPEKGYVERVFEHDLAAEEDGIVPVSIVNRGAGLGFYQLYKQDQLPHHFVWRMLGEGPMPSASSPAPTAPRGGSTPGSAGSSSSSPPGRGASTTWSSVPSTEEGRSTASPPVSEP